MATPVPRALHRMIGTCQDLRPDGPAVYCIPCDRQFMFYNTSHCKRHINSETHLRNKLKGPQYATFLFDLCFMMCACSLSWKLVDRRAFRNFWDKYVPQWPLPSSGYLRKKYLPRVYESVMDEITRSIEKQYMWVTVDETVDFKEHKVINVLVRVLNPYKSVPPLLIASRRVMHTTAITVEQTVTSALCKVRINNANVLIFVTDVAPYMIKAGQRLKQTYYNMIHVTCLGRSLHQVAEEIRNQFPTVDGLISNTKKIFIKTSPEQNTFQQKFPGIPLDPEPVCTQWCSWLKIVEYYSRHFEEIKAFIFQLDPNETPGIRHCQIAFEISSVRDDIQKIMQQFSVIVWAINKLEDACIPISEALEAINRVKMALNLLSDSGSVAIKNKLDDVLCRSPDYEAVCNSAYPSVLHLEYLPFAPLTSTDVELSFSLYKHMYRRNRSNLTAVNAERILVVTSYAKGLESTDC